MLTLCRSVVYLLNHFDKYAFEALPNLKYEMPIMIFSEG